MTKGRVSGTPSTSVETEALRYFDLGWWLVPVLYGGQEPKDGAWHGQHLDRDGVRVHFAAGKLVNVGAALGEPSGGLAEVLLGSPEVARAARRCLPETDVVFDCGPESHWLYVAEGATACDFRLRGDRRAVIAIRSDGDVAVLPPSTRLPGRVEWRPPRWYPPRWPMPPRVAAAALKTAVEQLALEFEALPQRR